MKFRNHSAFSSSMRVGFLWVEVRISLLSFHVFPTSFSEKRKKKKIKDKPNTVFTNIFYKEKKKQNKTKLLVNLFSGKLEQLVVRLVKQPGHNFSDSS